MRRRRERLIASIKIDFRVQDGSHSNSVPARSTQGLKFFGYGYLLRFTFATEGAGADGYGRRQEAKQELYMRYYCFLWQGTRYKTGDLCSCHIRLCLNTRMTLLFIPRSFIFQLEKTGTTH